MSTREEAWVSFWGLCKVCVRVHMTLYFSIVYCIVLYYTILYYIILYYTVVYYRILYHTTFYLNTFFGVWIIGIRNDLVKALWHLTSVL